ncbi:SNF2-related protein [Mycolicibacterium rhodesiae JS60]|nr:SNF2-related protein [Mycolicibacterium rhodesiae JS60]
MLVLHGFWSLGDTEAGGLCLWAEDPERTVKSPSQALRVARPHPFAAPADVVAALVGGKVDTEVLLLPSVRTAPLDSPELFRAVPRPDPRTLPVLLPWTVPVARLDAAEALRVFGGTHTDIRYGASVRFLISVAEFATGLVRRGQVLPTVTVDELGPVARWRPVFAGHDVVAVNSLTTAMPPVCRAHVPDAVPDSLVASAVDALVDASVRAALPAGLDLAPPRRGRRPQRPPAAEAWLGALTGPDGRFDADTDEIAVLAQQLAPWEEIGSSKVGPARATFRLTETESDEQHGWRVEFLLQSASDLSLLVDADTVWDDEGGLRRWLDRPQELLLAELGRAVRVYPELATGLRTARPTGLDLDTDGAYRFLSTVAPLLDGAGFGVLLPSWWDRGRRVGLAASAGTPVDGVVEGASRFSRDQLVDFRWDLAVGDDTLTDDEIAALAAAKAPLVRLRGQWVAVDPEQLRRGLEFLERNRNDTVTVGEVLALAAAADDAGVPLEVVAVRAQGWLGDLLSGAISATLQPCEPPPTLAAALRPYQQRGLSWLTFLSTLGLGACLADDMGLGKTVQLLALECSERHQDSLTGPTLLICPMSLVGNWQREAAKFAPALRVYAHHGAGRSRGDAFDELVSDSDLVVTTYATAVRDIEQLADRRWHRVVLDEAQAVKNRLSQGAKAIRRLDAGHRVALTGTPVENRLAELFSIIDFLNPGLLGSPEAFRTRYAIPVERYGHTEPAERLRAITRPYILRRVKTDPTIIDDLPEKIEIKQYCRLTAEQASLYQVVVDDMMTKIEDADGITRRGNVLAAMTKLKQVCNHPAQLLHDHSPIGERSGKLIRFEEILDEILAEGDRVLCFTQFTEFAEMLVPHLAARFGQDVAYLHGGTPKTHRDEMVAAFQSGTGPSIFILSLKAGGTGLTLTAANHVVHLDRWWNPAVENQATDRAFRIGQQRNVQVHKFICSGTLEERIDDMIEQKKALADLAMRDGEGWLTELSTGELRSLFALSEGAVGE